MNMQNLLTRSTHYLAPVVFGFVLAAGSVSAQAPDRSGPPELGPPPSLHLPDAQYFKLSNGLPVVLMPKTQIPLVQFTIVIRAGSAMESADKLGLASVTADMLDKGAGTRDALQLDDAIDFLGAEFSAGAATHTTDISINAPVAKVDSALALLADIALRPTFPQAELERIRKQRLTTLIQWHDEPRAIASVLFNRTLYGDKHPYGRPSLGDEKSLQSMNPADLKAFYERYYRSNKATIIVVGDMMVEATKAKLEKYFGGWQTAKVPTSTWPGIEQVSKRRIYLVDKPGAAQTEIRIGRIGAARKTSDYYALTVMNTLLGGSFTSRLNQNLREEHGYTYGARSAFVMRQLPGPFLASAAVQTEVTDKALTEFMKELRRIREPATDDEITRAKNYVALGYPSEFQSIGQVAGNLEELVVYDLSEEYFNNYIENILNVSTEEVQRVAEKYVDPDNIVIVLVGDRQAIEKGVRALQLGEIQLLTIDQVLGPAPKLSDGD